MCKCGFCCEDENFAHFVIGDTEKNSRIVMRSGGGRGLIILSEIFTHNRWDVLNVYVPKFCPECGRKLEILQ